MSEPLLPSDPSRLGGYRLLRRLGAGGMGVVYLGRSEDGAPAAVKAIRGADADDPGFRARFTREIELASRVDSPWVAGLMDADADAPTPWLATVYVPGPSLAEAVTAHGPLPPRTVRVLGAHLADALYAVHTAGFVHRDVKPGNVLLALDGPRLIDFGIARSIRGTGLTATGLVIGTPGFLAPEQATGDGSADAGDVFALGCVLAYAASGRPPFGTGTADALLYRTVHDEPDLSGVPDGIRERIAPLLDKDRYERPGTSELIALFGEDIERDAPQDAGTADHWLPDAVARTVARRGAEGLALPEVAPTAVDRPVAGRGGASPEEVLVVERDGALDDEAAEPDADSDSDCDSDSVKDATSPPRRRFLAAAGALLLAGGGTGIAVWASRDGNDPAAAPPPAPLRPVYVIGVHTTRTGDAARLGRACERAAHLAVAGHNADAKRRYDLEVKVLDDGGDQDGAVRVASDFVADRSVVAVLGPVTEIAMRLAAPLYDGASLTHTSATTGLSDFYVTSRKSSFQTMYSHVALGSGAALHAFTLAAARGATATGRLGIVLDRSGDTAVVEQGGSLAAQWRNTLKQPTAPRVIAASAPGDAEAAVRSLVREGIDAFAYMGPPDRTARAARTLAATGYRGPRWMSAQLYGGDFPRLAGAAGSGWYVVSSAVDPAVLTDARARAFTTAWRARYGTAPEPFAMEAYDSARLLLTEFAATVPAKPGADTRPARGALAGRMPKATFEGIDRTYAFGDYHQVRVALTALYAYEVRDAAFRQLGPVSPRGT
ncbi:bifunctional serine/threonine-protein kinase/ABC transporter substrate-binding protein [Streptomyces gardneri]|uniref:bifunctional serine/threonine-protein kinase/ABC transporter substrate-binding protein n=1 Tax=Streptomyces gardneri TaxID=66892 RepID=UPI0035D84511